MFLTISDVLSADQMELIRTELKAVRWLDGSTTAGETARQVKSNLQADLTSRSGVKIRDRLTQAIQSNPVLRAASQPARFSSILISKTQEGGGYGLHIDNPFMKTGNENLRTDLSYTLFLSDPSDYDGGDLCIETNEETKTFKPKAGTLILYPTRFLHEVKRVSGGARLACVGWIESRVKSENKRSILFDLKNLSASLSNHHDPQSEIMLTLSKVTANLKREFD